MDVVNNGHIVGSAAFYGKVTNNGTIGSADYFYGDYEGNGSNSSTVTLTLDYGSYCVGSIPDEWVKKGWEKVKGQPSQIQLKNPIIRGQKIKETDLPIFVREHYTWQGWYKGDAAFNFESHLEEDTTLIGMWQTNGTPTCKLVFDENRPTAHDGYTYTTTGTVNPLYFFKNETQALEIKGGFTCIFEESYDSGNCSFLGWNTQADGKGIAYKNGDAFTYAAENDKITLYAQWDKVRIVTKDGETYTYLPSNTDAKYRVTYKYPDNIKITYTEGGTPKTTDTLDEGEDKSFQKVAGNSVRLESLDEIKTRKDIYKIDYPEGKRFVAWKVNDLKRVFQPGERITPYQSEMKITAVLKDEHKVTAKVEPAEANGTINVKYPVETDNAIEGEKVQLICNYDATIWEIDDWKTSPTVSITTNHEFTMPDSNVDVTLHLKRKQETPPTSPTVPTDNPTPTPAPTSVPETPELPKTGDSASLGLWFTLAAIGCIGAVVILLYTRKRKS